MPPTCSAGTTLGRMRLCAPAGLLHPRRQGDLHEGGGAVERARGRGALDDEDGQVLKDVDDAGGAVVGGQVVRAGQAGGDDVAAGLVNW